MKRVLLINPAGTEQGGYTNPPLGLLYLAGTLLHGGFEVRVVDGCVEGEGAVERALQDFHPEIAGITCLTPARKKALQAAQLVKKINNGIITVMGGAHPTIMHSQIMENYPFVDYVVAGEGEAALLEIAQGRTASGIGGLVYRKNGEILKTAPRKYAENLDDIPFPAWHLVDLKKYPAKGAGIVNGIDLAKEPRVSVVFSRGCPGHCDFCSTWWIWRGWRHRSPANMADELELLYRDFGILHFFFADDSMTVDRAAAMGLCDEIIARRLKIAFHVTTRTDCVDEAVLSKLKAAGCYTIAFGIETASPVLLEKMGKENLVEASERAILLCRRVGIKVTALIIAGNVGETEDTISETVDFIRKTRPDDVGCVGGLWILPGTKLYRDCAGRGIINDDFWLGDEPYMVYTAEHSMETLLRMGERFANSPSFLQRAVSRLCQCRIRASGLQTAKVEGGAQMICAVCGGTAFDAWGRQGAYSILKCRSCGLGVTSPFPAAGQAEELNRKTYNGEQRAVLYSAREKEFKKRYGGYLARIKRFKPAGALLDVGCNIGIFMNAARQEGFAVTGIEMNGSCAAYGKEKFGLDIRASSLQAAAFPDGAFDVVTMFDVLEHVPDMRGFLAEVNRVLKSGGLLVAQSPNFDSFMARLMKENWSWLTPTDHLYHFTPGALERLLAGSGFSVRKVRTWEPASDFSGDIFSGFPARGFAGRAMRKLLWLAGIVLIFLLQRLWWKTKKGGLIEVYAVKTGR